MPPSLRNAVREAGDEKNLYNIIDVRGKASEVRKNTDGGVLRLRLSEAKNPRYKFINKTKPQNKGRRSQGATEHIKCLITTCIGLCRHLGASLVVALLPGACAPVCGLSSLRDLGSRFLNVVYPNYLDSLSSLHGFFSLTYLSGGPSLSPGAGGLHSRL